MNEMKRNKKQENENEHIFCQMTFVKEKYCINCGPVQEQ